MSRMQEATHDGLSVAATSLPPVHASAHKCKPSSRVVTADAVAIRTNVGAVPCVTPARWRVRTCVAATGSAVQEVAARRKQYLGQCRAVDTLRARQMHNNTVESLFVSEETTGAIQSAATFP